MPAPRKYSDELKERAVRLRLEQMDRSVAAVAADLGVHSEALRKWVHQHEADHGKRKDVLATAEREELNGVSELILDHMQWHARLSGECSSRGAQSVRRSDRLVLIVQQPSADKVVKSRPTPRSLISA